MHIAVSRECQNQPFDSMVQVAKADSDFVFVCLDLVVSSTRLVPLTGHIWDERHVQKGQVQDGHFYSARPALFQAGTNSLSNHLLKASGVFG